MNVRAVVAWLAAAAWCGGASASAHVQAELVSERALFGPGANRVAVRLVPDAGWHTYWKTPGDAGLPTTVAWDLPPGFVAGEIRWPAPETFRTGDDVTYGYSRPTLHVVDLVVPGSAVGSRASLVAHVTWLACADTCIPGRAELRLDRAVASEAGPPTRWAGEFASAVSLVPQPHPVLGPRPPPRGPAAVAAPSLALAVGLALLGGLVLNLMPCVFPVLSIKAIAIAGARGRDGAGARRQALAYTAGVVLSCMAAAGAILLLRGVGESAGWGFQLQSPVFVTLMAYLLFLLGLSLSGVVQIGTSIMGAGQGLTTRNGLAGSFFTGVLAVVVASPCTAPFMGTAVGYALVQPAVVALAIFAALGAGLALPFLLIGFVPALGRFLPRPGAWMDTFKQAMAFPLYLSVIWLVWVLARQSGVDAVPVALGGLALIAQWAWLRSSGGPTRRAVAATALLGAMGLLFLPELRAAPPAPRGTADWQSFSEDRLASLRSEGAPVLVDFTADWCLTCKLNERVLDADAVRAALRAHGLTLLRADWTRGDPEITRLLSQFGRAGVPLYVLYPAQGEPVVLPQVLTPAAIHVALEKLPG